MTGRLSQMPLHHEIFTSKVLTFRDGAWHQSFLSLSCIRKVDANNQILPRPDLPSSSGRGHVDWTAAGRCSWRKEYCFARLGGIGSSCCTSNRQQSDRLSAKCRGCVYRSWRCSQSESKMTVSLISAYKITHIWFLSRYLFSCRKHSILAKSCEMVFLWIGILDSSFPTSAEFSDTVHSVNYQKMCNILSSP